MATAIDTAVALVTLEEAKEYLKVTTSNEDAVLSHIVNAVSAWVAGYLKRNLVSAARVEYYSGDGSVELVLKNYPVTVLTYIRVDENRTFGSDTAVDSTDYILKPVQGIVRAFNLYGNWPCGESNIKVSYTAGYTVASSGTPGSSGTMPYDIRMATKRIIDRMYRIAYTNRKADVSSESISGMNITFNPDAVPKDAKSMLDGWKATMPSPQYEYAD